MGLLPFFFLFSKLSQKISVLSGQTSQQIKVGHAEDFQLKKNDTIVCEYLRYLFEGKKE